MQTRLTVAVPGIGADAVQKDRNVLTGKNSALLLLPACTLTYIRWNRVRRPATATETYYPEERKFSSRGDVKREAVHIHGLLTASIRARPFVNDLFLSGYICIYTYILLRDAGVCI